MSALEPAAVAKLLVELSRRTVLAGNNYFRSRAYLRAADSLAALAEPLDRTIGDTRLRQVPDIGDTIADIVIKLHRTGTHPLLEKLRRKVPECVLEMLSIPGLRPDRINILYKELGITDLAGLEAARTRGSAKKRQGIGRGTPAQNPSRHRDSGKFPRRAAHSSRGRAGNGCNRESKTIYPGIGQHCRCGRYPSGQRARFGPCCRRRGETT